MIPEINTSCEDCIFAHYESDKQIGCQLGRLEKFAKFGTPLSFTVSKTRKHHYVIEGRCCTLKRTSSWSIKQPFLQPIIARQEASIKYDVIICAYNTDLKSIQYTINQLNNQTLLPKNIFIILHNQKFRVAEVVKYMQNCDIPWKIDEEINNFNHHKSVNSVIKYSKSTFFAIIRAGEHVPFNYFSNLDKLIVDDLLRVVLVLPNNGKITGLTTHTPLYKTIRAQYPEGDIVPIIRYLATETTEKHIIRADELC